MVNHYTFMEITENRKFALELLIDAIFIAYLRNGLYRILKSFGPFEAGVSF